jgi:hypothetical protein
MYVVCHNQNSYAADEINHYMADEIHLLQMIYIHERQFEKINFPACDMIFSAFFFLFDPISLKNIYLLKKNINEQIMITIHYGGLSFNKCD